MVYNYLIYMAQVISLDTMSFPQLPFAITLPTAGLPRPLEARRHPRCAKLTETDRKRHFIVFCSCFTLL